MHIWGGGGALYIDILHAHDLGVDNVSRELETWCRARGAAGLGRFG